MHPHHELSAHIHTSILAKRSVVVLGSAIVSIDDERKKVDTTEES
jgi:hypothetical protein